MQVKKSNIIMISSDEQHLTEQRKGHRERLRQRLVNNGLGTFRDYEVIEFMLTLLLPRRDVKPLAKDLITHFGNVSAVLNAPVKELESFGLTSRTAANIHFFRELIDYYFQERLLEQPLLNNRRAVTDFLLAKLGNLKKEIVIVIYLDSAGHLLSISEHQGSTSTAAVSPRDIAEQSMRFGAVGVIIAHNHPSGSCQPSEEDLEYTRNMRQALHLFNVVLHDHLIIGKQSWNSLLN